MCKFYKFTNPFLELNLLFKVNFKEKCIGFHDFMFVSWTDVYFQQPINLKDAVNFLVINEEKLKNYFSSNMHFIFLNNISYSLVL